MASSSSEEDGDRSFRNYGSFFIDGRYYILKYLGYGTYATVWMAYDFKSETVCVIKIHEANENNTAIDELVGLQHIRNKSGTIIPCLNAFKLSNDVVCIVYPLYGEDLDAVMEHRRIHPSEISAIIAMLTLALHECRKGALIHTDIKPSNVLLTQYSETRKRMLHIMQLCVNFTMNKPILERARILHAYWKSIVKHFDEDNEDDNTSDESDEDTYVPPNDEYLRKEDVLKIIKNCDEIYKSESVNLNTKTERGGNEESRENHEEESFEVVEDEQKNQSEKVSDEESSEEEESNEEDSDEGEQSNNCSSSDFDDDLTFMTDKYIVVEHEGDTCFRAPKIPKLNSWAGNVKQLRTVVCVRIHSTLDNKEPFIRAALKIWKSEDNIRPVRLYDKVSDYILTDFGTCVLYRDNKDWYDNLQCLHYRAPEIIMHSHVTVRADLWSIGCMIYELYTKKVLFNPIKTQKYSRGHHHFADMFSLIGPIPIKMRKRMIRRKFHKLPKSDMIPLKEQIKSFPSWMKRVIEDTLNWTHSERRIDHEHDGKRFKYP